MNRRSTHRPRPSVPDTSVRSRITAGRLPGRVVGIASVLGWSVIPLGSLAGGFIISATGSVGGVYVVIGAVIAFVALAFTQTALAHADRYVGPTAKPAVACPADPIRRGE